MIPVGVEAGLGVVPEHAVYDGTTLTTVKCRSPSSCVERHCLHYGKIRAVI